MKQMKKYGLMVLIMLTSLSTAFAQQIAVLDFKAGVGISQSDVDGISAMFTTYFYPRGYTIVERSQVDQVLRQQDLQGSSITEDAIVRLGQILNVNKIVVGDVNIVSGQYNVDVRVVDVQGAYVTGRDGATFPQGTNYRETMKKLAERLASQIAIVSGPTGGTGGYSQPGKSPSGKVETILGYLQVYPEDLGSFNGCPNSVITAINRQKLNDYGDWRLPTNEELSLMATQKDKLGIGSISGYMSKENANSGGMKIVRLVRSGNTNGGELDEHEWVDLGLPSGTLWATCNVGATSSRDYGDYFSWGETKTKSYYGDESYNYSGLTGKYRRNENLVLKAEDDAATVNWGNGWRTPTNEEWEELLDKCTWTWSGSGFKVTGSNGNNIFLPAAGAYVFSQINDKYKECSYMSSTSSKDGFWGCFIQVDKNYLSPLNPRFGYSVRPVRSN